MNLLWEHSFSQVLLLYLVCSQISWWDFLPRKERPNGITASTSNDIPGPPLMLDLLLGEYGSLT